MDLFVIITGLLRDLLGTLNPFSWLRSAGYRKEFAADWRDAKLIQRIAFIFGVVLYGILVIAGLVKLLDLLSK